MRWRFVPPNPRSIRQERNRQAMKFYSPEWNDLSPADQLTWIVAYGDEPEGRKAFYRRNAILVRCYLQPSLTFVPAVDPGAIALNDFFYDTSVGGIFANFDLTDDQKDFYEIRARRTNWHLPSYQPYSETILVPHSQVSFTGGYQYAFDNPGIEFMPDVWPLPPSRDYTCAAGLSLIHEASGEEYRYPINQLSVV